MVSLKISIYTGVTIATLWIVRRVQRNIPKFTGSPLYRKWIWNYRAHPGMCFWNSQSIVLDRITQILGNGLLLLVGPDNPCGDALKVLRGVLLRMVQWGGIDNLSKEDEK